MVTCMECQRVHIITDAGDRVRAECGSCDWRSPWATPGPAWDDAPPRPPEFVSRVAELAAAAHLRRNARRVRPHD